jgi:hypothetical protein
VSYEEYDEKERLAYILGETEKAKMYAELSDLTRDIEDFEATDNRSIEPCYVCGAYN